MPVGLVGGPLLESHSSPLPLCGLSPTLILASHLLQDTILNTQQAAGKYRRRGLEKLQTGECLRIVVVVEILPFNSWSPDPTSRSSLIYIEHAFVVCNFWLTAILLITGCFVSLVIFPPQSIMSSSLLAPEDIMLPPSPPEYADEYAEEPTTTCTVPSTFKSRETGADVRNGTTTAAPAKMTHLIMQPTLNLIPKPYSSLSKTHLRSRSLASPAAPSMARAHSSPGPDSRGRYAFTANPGGSPSLHDSSLRRQSPLRVSVEDSLYPSISTLHISEPIAEHPELQDTPRSRKVQLDVSSHSPLSPGTLGTFPRTTRRRPSSPLYPSNSSPISAQASPIVFPAKFNESYPSYSFSSTSSMPSTPSSIRSRSPSISSLETIPDIPDAEAAAIEADQIAMLKAAADRADEAAAANKDFNRRRSAIDVSGSSSPLGNSRFGGLGSYGGTRADKRKRWSVCGAEGRQDLDLETIWED
ncbi:conserved hypothetical protein [Histoplasma capsulatum var. duboisii H88]|uniref:Uncharacterized protein n=1 Tax=Ajellomyces capsulatus (strain H88) TaxID=544711 RepID=F0UVR0_AJEC8|nr:conserved hypothetical protein [Histoplasma capsulatum var. duboisii H88]QSS50815.1 hypothetical protein I7I53_05965 [Histoplasma capsulatum var. duboisii H88]